MRGANRRYEWLGLREGVRYGIDQRSDRSAVTGLISQTQSPMTPVLCSYRQMEPGHRVARATLEVYNLGLSRGTRRTVARVVPGTLVLLPLKLE